jgi:hypothetical protein
MPDKTETLDFAGMYAAFKRVKVHIGLIIDEVRISGKSAHFVREPFSITLDEPAQIEADLLQRDVQSFLTTTVSGGLRDFAVRMEDGKIFVDATMQILVSVSVSAVCALRIDEGKKLFIDLESVSALGGSPKSMVQKQLDAINPVLDLSTLPVDGSLDSIEISNGKATLKGRLSPKPA